MEIELTLESIAHKGLAIARHNGRPIFVSIARPPFGVVGERVRVLVTKDKKSFAFADVIEVLEASPHRSPPRCQHYGVCGGCHLQHVDYATQLEYKRAVVAEQLARIGGLRDAVVLPTIPSPNEWGYRAHITLRPADDGRLGYVGVDGRTVIAINECPIAQPALVAAALTTPTPTADVRARLQVGMDDAGNTTGDTMAQIAAPTTAARAADADPNDDDAPIPVDTAQIIEYRVRGKPFRVTMGGFFQVNVAAAATLVELVLARIDVGSRVLDLYAGVGLFTAFLAEQASGVTAVEQYAPAIADMRHNLAGMTNVAMLEMTVENALRDLLALYDAVVIDPPRTGMSENAMERLLRLKPPRIIYVSCDPSTLARDAKLLTRAGYSLLDAQPVDMFPQTYHVETVATFVRS
ncbi:MAG: class I SAM-dependent RNA methyltransferase [Chloroflexota bacterium]|nr:class I SAM-dependent RNA methyltransferase [Chloroflexota bacterium]